MRGWLILMTTVVAVAGFGCASNVLWAGTCTATCGGGTTVSDTESVCASDTNSVSSTAQTAANQCATAVQDRVASCASPACVCTVVKSNTGC